MDHPSCSDNTSQPQHDNNPHAEVKVLHVPVNHPTMLEYHMHVAFMVSLGYFALLTNTTSGLARLIIKQIKDPGCSSFCMSVQCASSYLIVMK